MILEPDIKFDIVYLVDQMIVKDQLILKKNAIHNHVILKRKNAKIIIHFVPTGSKFRLNFSHLLSEK